MYPISFFLYIVGDTKHGDVRDGIKPAMTKFLTKMQDIQNSNSIQIMVIAATNEPWKINGKTVRR